MRIIVVGGAGTTPPHLRHQPVTPTDSGVQRRGSDPHRGGVGTERRLHGLLGAQRIEVWSVHRGVAGGRCSARDCVPVPCLPIGALQAAVAATDGKQPGDPMRAVAAIRDLVAAAESPVRLPLGSDCVALVEGKLASVAKDLDEWRELALSTDH